MAGAARWLSQIMFRNNEVLLTGVQHGLVSAFFASPSFFTFSVDSCLCFKAFIMWKLALFYDSVLRCSYTQEVYLVILCFLKMHDLLSCLERQDVCDIVLSPGH